MDIKNTIFPGDKIDISITGVDVIDEVYKSSVSDLLSDNLWEVTMPVSGSRMILFRTGMECDFLVFTRSNTIYSCKAVVRKRYKKDNLFFLEVEILSNLRKVQRRQFFRIACSADMNFSHIKFDEQTFKYQNMPTGEGKAVIVDISAGGIRFSSNTPFEKGEYILAEFTLESEQHHDFSLVCRIIESFKNDKADGKYVNRAQFLFEKLSDREKIVKYVFDEERRIRKREIG